MEKKSAGGKSKLVDYYVLLVLHHLVSVLIVIFVMRVGPRLGQRRGHIIRVSILRRRIGLTNRGVFRPVLRPWLGLELLLPWKG